MDGFRGVGVHPPCPFRHEVEVLGELGGAAGVGGGPFAGVGAGPFAAGLAFPVGGLGVVDGLWMGFGWVCGWFVDGLWMVESEWGGLVERLGRVWGEW